MRCSPCILRARSRPALCRSHLSAESAWSSENRRGRRQTCMRNATDKARCSGNAAGALRGALLLSASSARSTRMCRMSHLRDVTLLTQLRELGSCRPRRRRAERGGLCAVAVRGRVRQGRAPRPEPVCQPSLVRRGDECRRQQECGGVPIDRCGSGVRRECGENPDYFFCLNIDRSIRSERKTEVSSR